MGFSERHPGMILRGEQPFNAESPLGPLRESFVTPAGLFYIRDHGLAPQVEPDRYRLAVSGLVENTLSLTLDEVRSAFSRREVTAVVQCAGNRRDGLMRAAPIPDETPWGAGAIGNARWAGAPLREVLEAAGVQSGARHAAFSGLDEAAEGWSPNYGASIPIEKALSPEVLLAYEMNGEPLPPEHGFPLRVIVPGYVGARSVKWLSGVRLQEEPSDNYHQAHEYKLFPPNATAETTDFAGGGIVLEETPVNAVICAPEDGASVAAGPLALRGYAVVGGGRRIERVDLSADGGETWTQARLTEGEDDVWAWRFWEAELELAPGSHWIFVRAVDSSANAQPESAAGVWNFRGYANNSWHGVEVEAR